MARRLSTGVAGRNVLGSFVAVENNLRSVIDNADVVLQANGTGIARSTTHLQINDANSLRLADADSSAYVALRAPNTVASDVVLTLPDNEGTAGQALVTDGSGNLSFANNFLTVADRTSADSNTYYIAMSDQTSGNEDTLSIASDRMSFVPNPGTLTVNSIVCNNVDIGGGSIDGVTLGTNSAVTNAVLTSVDINGGAIDGTTIGANTRANGSFSNLTATSITEDSSIAFKENVVPINDALNTITKLSGVLYDRKDGSAQNEAGLIAEEVNEILPNLVTKDKNGNPVGINYTKFSAYLIESVKALKVELDNIKGTK